MKTMRFLLLLLQYNKRKATMEMIIDPRLTVVNISKLVADSGIPFHSQISEDEIEKCVKSRMFLAAESIYKINDGFSYTGNTAFDLLKIATIVNEIRNNTYNFNYPIPIWEDEQDDGTAAVYDTDGNGSYQIRAFWHCRRDMPLSINRSG